MLKDCQVTMNSGPGGLASLTGWCQQVTTVWYKDSLRGAPPAKRPKRCISWMRYYALRSFPFAFQSLRHSLVTLTGSECFRNSFTDHLLGRESCFCRLWSLMQEPASLMAFSQFWNVTYLPGFSTHNISSLKHFVALLFFFYIPVHFFYTSRLNLYYLGFHYNYLLDYI